MMSAKSGTERSSHRLNTQRCLEYYGDIRARGKRSIPLGTKAGEGTAVARLSDHFAAWFIVGLQKAPPTRQLANSPTRQLAWEGCYPKADFLNQASTAKRHRQFHRQLAVGWRWTWRSKSPVHADT